MLQFVQSIGGELLAKLSQPDFDAFVVGLVRPLFFRLCVYTSLGCGALDEAKRAFVHSINQQVSTNQPTAQRP